MPGKAYATYPAVCWIILPLAGEDFGREVRRKWETGASHPRPDAYMGTIQKIRPMARVCESEAARPGFGTRSV
ncbi:hypothetical protein FHS31_001737 [Sphingomonas vulcanisoli]|uniref:Uncharacterized protein n=1 Tax=Sphingomonas vulcanisoli TaxID=1658060 RepID=A0ABX0TUR3_9SPHN|nr:hypothetical protein [Sphingomonas vulcanisoli]